MRKLWFSDQLLNGIGPFFHPRVGLVLQIVVINHLFQVMSAVEARMWRIFDQIHNGY